MLRLTLMVLLLTVISQVCGYKQFTLNRLCSTNDLMKVMFEFITNNKNEVQLKWEHDSAAIVGQHWNASTMPNLPVCHFRVDARKYAMNTDRGIYASVRHMKLRRNGGPTGGGPCIDFVSFKRENGVSSGRLCGDYEASDDYSGDESKFFADDGGLLYVHVELDSSKKLSPNEELYVKIVLTAYEKNCVGLNRTMCSPSRCISRVFENDGIINCSPQRCSDEVKCMQQVPIIVQPPISGTHIAISAITSLLMTMICVLCVYMCCKCKYDNRAAPNGTGSSIGGNGGSGSASGRAGQRAADGDFQNIDLTTRGGLSPEASSSAQPMNASAPDLDDKDLPPSYESLFKKQNNVISV